MKHYTGWRDGFASCDPRTGEVFYQREAWTAQMLSQALSRAAAAAQAQARTTLAERAEQLARLADAIDEARTALVDIVSRETGKLPAEADDEIVRSAKWCRFIAQQAPAWLSNEQNGAGRLLRKSLGVILAVTPWNYPVWQLLRPLAAALTAGNAVVLKPAPNVPQTSALVETLCRDVLPTGLMQCLWVDELGTRQALGHPDVAMLVCTGSESTGRQLGMLAAHHLKPAVLELGGNNPFIVLDDAEVEAAAQSAAQSRCLNAGQACTAAKRFIVTEGVAARFEAALIDALSRYRCGDNLAPLARADLRNRLAQQVHLSIEQGARPIMGGEPASGRGNYYPPTLLRRALPGTPAFDDELFGPVAVLCTARDDADALQLANAVRQRLTASIWSADRERAEQLANGLQAGMV